jgi:Glu-tRNA(Gln) amidotransferase subunit E-like FAD-binding protein
MASAKKRRSTKKPLWLRDLLNVDSIVEEAISELIKEMNVKSFLEILISRNLYEVLKKLEKKAHEIYKHYEDEVREKFMKGYYGKNIDANEFEKSLTNTRRRRAGETFEKIFLKILSEYKVPYEDHVNMCGLFRSS